MRIPAVILFPVVGIAFPFFSCTDQGVAPVPRPIEVRPLTSSEQKLVQANSAFWLGLFKEIEKDDRDKNVFVSPLSVSMALGMTLNGAGGSTLDSMRLALQFSGMSMQEINESYKSLIGLLTGVDPSVQFQIANSIWYRNTVSVEKEFIDINKMYFDAVIAALDFSSPGAADIINSWVREKTSGKISQIVDKPIPDEIVLYLINALYFKGAWTSQFKKEKTRDDLFTLRNGSKVSCKMMNQENTFGYYGDNEFQAVDLMYGGEAFSMTILLPRNDIDISSFVESFETSDWDSLVSRFRKTEVAVSLPRFTLEYDKDLIPTLKALGMAIACDGDRADFTKINKNGGLYISQAKHKTFVEVNEEGTEAAAVTSIGIGVTSGPPMVRLDRPFVYVIRERNSKAVLFVGKMMSPGS